MIHGPLPKFHGTRDNLHGAWRILGLKFDHPRNMSRDSKLPVRRWPDSRYLP